MGLTLQVAGAADAFLPDFSVGVVAAVERATGYRLPEKVGFLRRYASREMAWGWIGNLQEDAARVLGATSSTHLLACDSWCSVYLPRPMAPVSVKLPRTGRGSVEVTGGGALAEALEQVVEKAAATAPAREPLLVCASAPALVSELLAYGSAARLAVDPWGLRRLIGHPWARVDASPHEHAYAVLLRAAQLACARSLPLWIVK